jgi:NAD dependent epimerase/dehydratase
MRALVTGAAGFIGSHLVELLVREGYDVRAFVHYNSYGRWPNLEQLAKDVQDAIEIFPGDICDARVVAEAVTGCEWVFHLAALIAIPYSYVAPASYVQTNVAGSLNVLEACRLHKVKRLIHTSTSETYGSAQYVPINEQHPLVGQSPYSATKIAGDKLAESFWLSFGTPVTVLRPFNTYGPRQSQRALIPTIVTQALNGNTISLGNLEPVRDLTFVTDTATGFLAVARSSSAVGELINLGVGNGTSVRELVDRVGHLLGRKLEIEQSPERVRPENSEVMRLISDNRKARSLTGWTPQVELDAGLRATVDHIRAHPDDYRVRGYVI